MGKNDPRILAIVTRELVAAEACYHKSCYPSYTRNLQGAVSSGDKKEEDECREYTKPKRTPSEMKDQKVNTGIFKPITRLNSGENSV